MREAGVKARHRKKFKITTNSDHQQPVFDNVLARDFSAAEPHQAYVGEILCAFQSAANSLLNNSPKLSEMHHFVARYKSEEDK